MAVGASCFSLLENCWQGGSLLLNWPRGKCCCLGSGPWTYIWNSPWPSVRISWPPPCWQQGLSSLRPLLWPRVGEAQPVSARVVKKTDWSGVCDSSEQSLEVWFCALWQNLTDRLLREPQKQLGPWLDHPIWLCFPRARRVQNRGFVGLPPGMTLRPGLHSCDLNIFRFFKALPLAWALCLCLIESEAEGLLLWTQEDATIALGNFFPSGEIFLCFFKNSDSWNPFFFYISRN